jgi:hypothetical protein
MMIFGGVLAVVSNDNTHTAANRIGARTAMQLIRSFAELGLTIGWFEIRGATDGQPAGVHGFSALDALRGNATVWKF